VSDNKFRINIDPQALVPSSSNRIYYLVSIIVIAIMFVAIGLVYRYLPRVVPLYFTEPWGEARLAPRISLFALPGMASVVTIINLVLGRVYKDEQVLPTTLSVANMMVAIMFLIGVFGIAQSVI